MKKILTFAFAFAMIIPCMFMATGCGSFAENTFYKFSNIEVKFESNEIKEAFEAMLKIRTNDETMTIDKYIQAQKEEMQKDATFTKFVPAEGKEGEGVVESYIEVDGEKEKQEHVQYYTVDGNEIHVWVNEDKTGDADYTLKIEGNNIVMEMSEEGVTSRQIMTKA